MPSYQVRKLKLDKTGQLDSLARAAGELYSRTLVSFWRTVRKKDVWLSGYSMEKWHTSNALHAHSSDAVVQCFYASLKSWRARRKTNPNSKPQKKRRWFFKLIYKSTAIKLKDGKLILYNGRENKPLIVNWQWDKPKIIELGWNKASLCYELRACYASSQVVSIEKGGVCGCDLGEIHPMVFADGINTDIFNGRLLRSKRQYQNKLKAKLAGLIDKKKKGSRRRKRLIKSKQKQLARLNNQIKEIEHKLTSLSVSRLKKRSIQTLVIGDVRDIRQELDYGKKSNQKLHQWSFGSIRQKLEYKCARSGIKTVLISEEYTSQECLACRKRNKPKNRNYKCNCGFKFHRDGVGSNNIRAKYLGEVPVVGLMASSSGVRYTPHLQCNPVEKTRLGNPRNSIAGE